MKKVFFIAALLACLTACEKVENKAEQEKEAKLILEWNQTDNIKPYVNPLVAYRINGGKVVIEAPSNKSIDLPYEGSKVEIAFLSQETSKDLGTLISDAKVGEKVSYSFYAAVAVYNGDKETRTGSSFNVSPLLQSVLRDAEGQATVDADELKSIVFDEFNLGGKYDPADKKTKMYQRATGKDRKLVLTWEGNDDYPKTQMSYENGNLFE